MNTQTDLGLQYVQNNLHFFLRNNPDAIKDESRLTQMTMIGESIHHIGLFFSFTHFNKPGFLFTAHKQTV